MSLGEETENKNIRGGGCGGIECVSKSTNFLSPPNELSLNAPSRPL